MAQRLPQIEHIIFDNNKNRLYSFETVSFCTNQLTSLSVSPVIFGESMET